MPDDLLGVSRSVADRWFDRLWSKHRWEVEVTPARRISRLRVQEGIRLYAPFGLGEGQDQWWLPVRERPLLGRQWRYLRTLPEAERELDELLRTADERTK